MSSRPVPRDLESRSGQGLMEEAEAETVAGTVAAWLASLAKSHSFVYGEPPPQLGVAEALTGPALKKVCDPFGRCVTY